MRTMQDKLEKVRNVYSFWGRFPFLYSAQDMITFLGRARTIRSQAVKNIGLKKGDRAIEVACGSGRNFRYLEDAVGREGKIIGFDYSEEMLNSAKRLCERNEWNNIKLIQGDAAQLKIKDRDFDGVLSVLGISAIPRWESALKRCHEILRNGGRLVVCDARLFTGTLRILNPLVKLIYSRFAAWDSSKNIPREMNEIFGNVEVETCNLGTFFIAVSVRRDK